MPNRTLAGSAWSSWLLSSPTGRASDRSFRAPGRSARRRWRRTWTRIRAARRSRHRRVDAINGIETGAVQSIPLATQSLVTLLSGCSCGRQHGSRQNGVHCLVRSLISTDTVTFQSVCCLVFTACTVYAMANSSVCLSVRPSHYGIVSKWGNAEGCGLHQRVAQCV